MAIQYIQENNAIHSLEDTRVYSIVKTILYSQENNTPKNQVEQT